MKLAWLALFFLLLPLANADYAQGVIRFSVTNITNQSYAPVCNPVFTQPINPDANATVMLAANCTDRAYANTYPNSYGAGMLGNYTITTNATNSLYTNYLQSVSSDYYSSVTFGKNQRIAQTFKIPAWSAFGQPLNGTTNPPIERVCARLYQNNATASTFNVTMDIHGAMANGSVNKSMKLATTILGIPNTTTYLWYCGVLNQSLYLTANTNYTFVLSANQTGMATTFRSAASYYNSYPLGRYWSSANNGTSWTLGSVLLDVQFIFYSKPIEVPTWITMNASAWRSNPAFLKNSTAGDFREPSITEDFTNSFQGNGTTPIGWNASGSGQLFGVQPSSLCTDSSGGSIGLPCLYFNDTATNTMPSTNYYFSSGVRYARISFTMVNKNSTGSQWVALYSNYTASVLVLRLGMNGSLFRYTNGTNASYFETIANTSNFLNTFLNVTLDVNTVTAKFNLTVNGNKVLNKGLAQTTQTYLGAGIKRIYLYNWLPLQTGQSWIANITVKDYLFGLSAWANQSIATPDDPGYYNFFYKVWDTDGNVGITGNTTLCVGIVGGCGLWSRIISPENNSFVNGNVTLVGQITSPYPIANATYQVINASNPTGSWTTVCTLTSAPFTQCNWDIDGLLDGSTWLANIIVYDTSGGTNNNTQYAVNSSFIVDRRIPGVFNQTVIYPVGQTCAWAGQNVTLNLTASDFSGAGLANITVDTTDTCGNALLNMSLWSGGAGSNQTGNWTATCTIDQMTPDIYSDRITATDRAIPIANVNNGNFFNIDVCVAQSTSCTYLGYGDWLIPNGTSCYFGAVTLNITGNFNISGNATFNGTTVLINSSVDGQYGIWVYGNATILNNATFAPNQTGFAYSFIAEAGSYFEIQSSTVSGAGWSNAIDQRGLEIRTSNAIINSSLFTNGQDGLNIEGVSPTITNNTASYNHHNGFYFTGLSNIVVYNSTVLSNWAAGIFDSYGNNVTYLEVNGLDNNYCIQLDGTSSSFVYHANCTQDTGGANAPIYFIFANNNVLNQSSFNVSGYGNLFLSIGASGNSVYDTSFSCFDSPPYLSSQVKLGSSDYDVNLYMHNVTFGSNCGTAATGGLQETASSGFTVVNSTIPLMQIDSSTGDLFVDSDLSGYFEMNNGAEATVRNSTIPIPTFLSNDNQLVRQWYVDVHVINGTGVDVVGASVASNDSFGNPVFTGVSNATGMLGSWQNVSEYLNSSGVLSNYTPHYFNATDGSVWAWNQSSIVYSQVVVVDFNATHPSPTPTPTPTPSGGNTVPGGYVGNTTNETSAFPVIVSYPNETSFKLFIGQVKVIPITFTNFDEFPHEVEIHSDTRQLLLPEKVSVSRLSNVTIQLFLVTPLLEGNFSDTISFRVTSNNRTVLQTLSLERVVRGRWFSDVVLENNVNYGNWYAIFSATFEQRLFGVPILVLWLFLLGMVAILLYAFSSHWLAYGTLGIFVVTALLWSDILLRWAFA